MAGAVGGQTQGAMSKKSKRLTLSHDAEESNGAGDVRGIASALAAARGEHGGRSARLGRATQRLRRRAKSAGEQAATLGAGTAEIAKTAAPDVAAATTKAATLVRRFPVPSAIGGAFLAGFTKGRKRRRRSRRS